MDQEDGEYWYYLSSKGEAFNDEAKDAKAQNAEGVTAEDLYTGDLYYNVAAKVINSKTYLFDENGRVLNGVLQLEGEAYRSGGTKLADGGIYFFSTDDGSENGQMQTGKTEYDDEGESVTYYFKSNGQAYTNALVSGVIYDAEGKRVDYEINNYIATEKIDDYLTFLHYIKNSSIPSTLLDAAVFLHKIILFFNCRVKTAPPDSEFAALRTPPIFCAAERAIASPIPKLPPFPL